MPTFDDTLTRILRLGNLFDGSQMSDHPGTAEGVVSFDSAEGSPMTPIYEPINRASRMTGPNYGSLITEHVQNYPRREAPGLSRRIVSGLMGFGGDTRGGLEFLDRPYNQAVDDWTNQMRGLQSGALSQYRYGSLAARNKSNELRAARQNNPNLKFEQGRDGYIYALDPATGTSANTGVQGIEIDDQTKHLLDLELVGARTAGQLEVAGAKGDESRRTISHQGDVQTGLIDRRQEGAERLERLRQTGREAVDTRTLERTREQHQNTLEQIIARANSETAMTPNEQKTAMLNRVREMQAKHPDLEIDIDRENLEIKRPGGTWWSSPTEDQLRRYQEAIDYIVGGGVTETAGERS